MNAANLMKHSFRFLRTMALAAAAVPLVGAPPAVAAARFRLVTLDPGHFHAALVQKSMYADVDPLVHVYAPVGDDVAGHLKRIEGFNTRAQGPTRWREQVYTGPDFLSKMLAEKAGNVVVLSGNNARKTDYIVRAIDAGLHVLADKPMVRTPADLVRLQQAFKAAEAQHVLLYDIMTERFEVATILQGELSRQAALFGQIVPGTPADPAIVMEGVHYFSKLVGGVPLRRPTWFFDPLQQGDGIVDVTTHLVDLIQCQLFPGQALSPADVTMLTARRWTTPISPAQFKLVTGAEDFPAFLSAHVREGVLLAPANGEFSYTLRGIHARVSSAWDFAAAAGGDTHHSILRGTKAKLEIRQTAAEKYKPTLYVRAPDATAALADEATLAAAIAALQSKYPGVGFRRADDGWMITVPEKYDIGHEAHFAQVTENFLGYLRAGRLPAWEVPNMITKYSTIMRAYELSLTP